MSAPKVVLKWNGPKVEAKLRRALNKGAMAAARLYRRELVRSLQANQGSYIDKIHSAPGQIPYHITGKYSKSIKVTKHDTKHIIKVKIHITAPKQKVIGKWLEYGTPGGKIAARPHWRVIYNRYKKQMKTTIKVVAKSNLGDDVHVEVI